MRVTFFTTWDILAESSFFNGGRFFIRAAWFVRIAVRLMKRENHAQCVKNTHGGVVGKKKKG
jgi:hypothetical protein